MSEADHPKLTELLREITGGDKEAMDRVLPLVYNELYQISSRYLNEEYREHTFQTSDLVHEAYIKLAGDKKLSLESRAHFFGIAARTMRRILVDYARKRKAQKRGKGNQILSLDEVATLSYESDNNILELDDALTRLETTDERSGRIVELRYFSGLSVKETAAVLSVSESTVKREWNYAKSWLYREMKS